MILYMDASALVKRYIAESGSEDVNAWISTAEATVTSLVTRTEVAAAICRAARMKLILEEDAQKSLQVFRTEWNKLQRLPVTETTAALADHLACEHGLRGYDAIHLAATMLWQETLNIPVILVTFDNELILA